MITIKKGNIIYEDVECIVNAANERLIGGGGVDAAIRLGAGRQVLVELSKIKGCETGKAVMTSGGNLKAKKIIHAVGPIWRGGNRGEEDKLRSAYEESFRLAREAGMKTIAFPAISTGAFCYPIEQATRVAFQTARSHEETFKEIRFIVHSDDDLAIYEKVKNEKS
jgi:O-acetyl-ADP-ribose deacetylase (regulator of RNase III)